MGSSVTKGHIKWWDAYYKQFIKSLQEINDGIQRTWDAADAIEKYLPQKSVSSSTRLPKIKDSQQDSGTSPKEVSSKSKENSPSKKNSANIETADQIHQPEHEKNHSPPANQKDTLNSFSKGYLLSPKFVRNLSPEKINALIDKDASTRITNSTIEGKDDSLILLQNSDNSKSKDAQVLFKSKRPTPQISIVVKDDSELEDLVKVIFETKAGSSQGVSFSEAKFVQQNQPSTPVFEKNVEIAKMRLESSMNKLLISAAKKMIRLLSHSIYEIQTSKELTFELTRISSCLVKNQFPPEYREKHLEEASLKLESYSKDREALEKEIAAIQSKIKDIDDKVAKIRVPFEKIQSEKQELDANLARIA
ncbi:hypothetical protein PIB30_072859 [Stylosanthes scabra]|uniref:Uncharacterized protein n=1 Tax=Stylosanthes scabra TaxID=79078 RepID=A0ABU6ZMZ4_9FABA|nr:hypothetical protein [Stylosanthes scabra]